MQLEYFIKVVGQSEKYTYIFPKFLDNQNKKDRKMGHALDPLDQSNCDPSVCEATKVRHNFPFSNYLDYK